MDGFPDRRRMDHVPRLLPDGSILARSLPPVESSAGIARQPAPVVGARDAELAATARVETEIAQRVIVQRGEQAPLAPALAHGAAPRAKATQDGNDETD